MDLNKGVLYCRYITYLTYTGTTIFKVKTEMNETVVIRYYYRLLQ